MADINISRSHTLGKDEAKNRANQVLDRLKSQGIEGSWSGYTFNITKPAKGTFTITDTNVAVAIDLPFLMRPLKGTIEDRVKKELDRSLT
ncbi:MAG: polyhydroxyalkanoic acid system family protein [Deltaproteobacteria bacterium]|nr:polyhydroxyalkanoic acid system family protein [Deltaproteobacteria bacterium]